MKPGRGKQKGNAYENRIAKMIRAHFQVDAKDCYRSPGSGGHRIRGRRVVEYPGDLIISKRLRRVFPFVIEAKHRASFTFGSLFNSGVVCAQWLSHARQDARAFRGKEKVYPLGVFRGNRFSREYAFIRTRDMRRLKLRMRRVGHRGNVFYGSFVELPKTGKLKTIWTVLPLDEFLDLFPRIK